MHKQSSKVVIGSHYWSGISGLFARGGQVDGPPEVLAAFSRILERDADRVILGMIDDVLPYSLLFDEVYVPTQQKLGLSEELVTDLQICMGVRFADAQEMGAFLEKPYERGEHLLGQMYRDKEYGQLVSLLYRIAGPFAADHPDFIPVLSSMNASVHLSKNLGARLSCKADEVRVLRFVAQNTVKPSVDERLKVIDHVLQAHGLPVLNLEAFKNEDGLINLTNLFSTMEELRRSSSLEKFRAKIDELANVPESSLKSTIDGEIVEDLKATLEEVVLSPKDTANRMITAILTDIVGILVPIPTGTLLEGIALASEKKKTQHLEWRLFVLEYGKKVGRPDA